MKKLLLLMLIVSLGFGEIIDYRGDKPEVLKKFSYNDLILLAKDYKSKNENIEIKVNVDELDDSCYIEDNTNVETLVEIKKDAVRCGILVDRIRAEEPKDIQLEVFTPRP